MMIYLVRHGKDDDTVRGGWSDHGLLPLGIKQAETLAQEIHTAGIAVGRIYSSDIRRAAETAEILAHFLGCPVAYMPELREVNNGVLAGMKNDLAEEKYPGLYWSTLDYDAYYPGGESPEMFYHRIKTVWSALKIKVAERSVKDVLVVTHGGVIEAILCMENGITFSNKEKHFSVPHAKLIPIEWK